MDQIKNGTSHEIAGVKEITFQTAVFEPPAFIVGEQRSGTTLLAAILNRHAEICVTPETHFYRRLKEMPELWESTIAKWPTSCEAYWREIHNAYLFNLTCEDIILRIQRPYPSTRDFFLALGNSYSDKAGKPLWIEKTPYNVRCLTEIRRDFPTARIINIIRDGRDVALSLSEVDWEWQDKRYIANLIDWKTSIKEAMAKLGKDCHTLNIRYENLVRDPKQTINQVCTFLGVRYEPKMLMPDGSENVLMEKGTVCKNNILKPISPHNACRWKRDINKTQQLLGLMLIGDDLINLGYATSNEIPATKRVAKICKTFVKNQWTFGDDFYEGLVNTGFFLRLEEGSVHDWSVDTSEVLWITGGSIANQELHLSNSVQRALELAKLIVRLFKMRLKNISLIWLYHGQERETRSWPYRRMTEQFIANYAKAVICLCKSPSCCIAHELLAKNRSDIFHAVDPNAWKALLPTIKQLLKIP